MQGDPVTVSGQGGEGGVEGVEGGSGGEGEGGVRYSKSALLSRCFEEEGEGREGRGGDRERKKEAGKRKKGGGGGGRGRKWGEVHGEEVALFEPGEESGKKRACRFATEGED